MPQAEMRRFQGQFLKEFSASDVRQVPASGSSLKVFRQGASVRTAATLFEGITTTVEVFDCGALMVGDTVTFWPDGTQLGIVEAVNFSARTIDISYADPGSVSLVIGSRVAPTNPSPALTVYSDAGGTIALVDSVAVLGSEGDCTFYCRAARFDALLYGGGISQRFSADFELGWFRGGFPVINAHDYPTIQAAIDALPAGGGSVFIPSGVYTLSTTLYTPCDRRCDLIGEGASLRAGHGTVLRWTTNVAMLRLRGDGSSVRGMTLENTNGGSASSESTGYGIAVGRRTITDVHRAPGIAAGTEYNIGGQIPCSQILIEDVNIIGSPGWGLYIPGFGYQSDGLTREPDYVDGGTLSFWVDCKRVRIRGSRKYGACFTGGGCTTLSFEDCAFLGVGSEQVPNDNYYVYVSESPGTAFVQCTFEGTSPASKEWVKLWKTQNTVFDSCWFEEDAHSSYTPTPFIFLSGSGTGPIVGCQGGSIRDCHFVRGSGNNGLLKFIKVAGNGGARGLSILNPDGVSSTAIRNTDVNQTYKDTAHIDLGGNENYDITIVGSGMVYDQSVAQKLPIQYSGIPRTSNVQGRLLSKVPGVYGTELTSPSDSQILATQNGNLVLNWDLPGGTQVGALMCFWGGAHPGWRLANNLPTLTTTQRDGVATSVQGDMIYNSTTGTLEILIGPNEPANWKTVTLT